jgi:hypothetical protein
VIDSGALQPLEIRHAAMRKTPKSKMFKTNTFIAVFLSAASLLLAACAPMVPSAPVEFTPAPEAVQGKPLELRVPLELKLSTGYSRTLAAGSRWQPVGRVPQGIVYRPVNSVFSIEGRQVHEAYLVIDHAALQGFYLPGEARYSPLDPGVQLPPGAFQ